MYALLSKKQPKEQYQILPLKMFLPFSTDATINLWKDNGSNDSLQRTPTRYGTCSKTHPYSPEQLRTQQGDVLYPEC